MRLLIILATGLFTLSIFAQDVAPITLADELSKLGGQAELLRHDLPSITCREEATSQLIKKSKISQEVRFVAEVRVQRGNHDLLAESYNFEQLNGSPYSGPEPRTPFFVEGAVNEGMLFFLPAAQPFFTFTLSPGRLDFKASPGVSGQSAFGIPPSTHGFALLDRSGNVTHIERRADPKEAASMRVTSYAAYDFLTTELNAKIYILATRNVAENSQGSEVRHFEANISNCQLFHASSKILPGANPVPAQSK